MAFSLRQTITVTGTSPQTTANFTSTSGNALIVAAGQGSNIGGNISVSDNKGNVYTRAVFAENTGASGNTASIWYSTNITGGNSHTVTVSYSISSSVGAIVEEWAGVALSSALDQIASQTTTGSNPSSTSTPTTTIATELVVGVTTGNPGDTGAGTGYGDYTQISIAGHPMSIEDKTVSTTGAYSADWTGASNNVYAATVATFKVDSSTTTSTSTSISSTSTSVSSTSSSTSATSTSHSSTSSSISSTSSSVSSTSTSLSSTSTSLSTSISTSSTSSSMSTSSTSSSISTTLMNAFIPTASISSHR